MDAYTRSALQCTPGSKYAYTYDRATAKLEEHLTPDNVPDWEEGEEQIYFSFNEIFVLENEKASTLSWNMAGNTAEYDGEYGEVPEGAYIRWLTGYLYKDGDGWRCDSLGIGL